MSHQVPPRGDGDRPSARPDGQGIQSPLEGYSRYRGADWSPQRLAFHQNLEQFADRVGLIVGLQAGGKLRQSDAYGEIRKLWAELEHSRQHLLHPPA